MKYLPYVVCLMLLVSCRKADPPEEMQTCNDNCYVISGRLTDGSKPLSGVRLKLVYEERNPPLGMVYGEFGEVYTNEDGHYSFTFSSKGYEHPRGTFEIIGYKDGHFSHPQPGGDSVLTTFFLDTTYIDRPYIADLHLFRTAWLKLGITSVPASRVHVNYRLDNQEFSSGYFDGPDRFSTCKTAGGVPTIITWRRYGKKGGIEAEGSDTLVLSEGEERLHMIDPL